MEKDNNILQQISKKLSILIALQLQGGKEKVEVKENVVKLTPFGLTDSEIAEILGTTAGTVSVAKARIKKTKTK
jgi:DNA-binding NarL/FixJ family response regulator